MLPNSTWRASVRHTTGDVTDARCRTIEMTCRGLFDTLMPRETSNAALARCSARFVPDGCITLLENKT